MIVFEDFGVDHLVRLAGEMNFPWLMSNVRAAQTGELLADGRETHIITWEGRKVGQPCGTITWEGRKVSQPCGTITWEGRKVGQPCGTITWEGMLSV